MFQIVEYPTVHKFYEVNKRNIYSNRLAHYHLIKYFKELNAGEQSIYASFNVTDDDGGNVIAVWGDSVYYLYGSKWSDELIDGLLSKIEIAKYTKRFSFCGTSKLIQDLFNKSGVAYTVFKERILYNCDRVIPLLRACKGSAVLSTMDDLENVAEMTYNFGLEEWGEREGRDVSYARQISNQSISNETSCHWESDGVITTIASILDSDTSLPIIGSLYTVPVKRGNGFAKCLVHEMTSQLTKDGQCGIVADASHQITNRMFQEIGFKEVSRYISVNTTREKI